MNTSSTNIDDYSSEYIIQQLNLDKKTADFFKKYRTKTSDTKPLFPVTWSDEDTVVRQQIRDLELQRTGRDLELLPLKPLKNMEGQKKTTPIKIGDEIQSSSSDTPLQIIDEALKTLSVSTEPQPTSDSGKPCSVCDRKKSICLCHESYKSIKALTKGEEQRKKKENGKKNKSLKISQDNKVDDPTVAGARRTVTSGAFTSTGLSVTPKKEESQVIPPKVVPETTIDMSLFVQDVAESEPTDDQYVDVQALSESPTGHDEVEDQDFEPIDQELGESQNMESIPIITAEDHIQQNSLLDQVLTKNTQLEEQLDKLQKECDQLKKKTMAPPSIDPLTMVNRFIDIYGSKGSCIQSFMVENPDPITQSCQYLLVGDIIINQLRQLENKIDESTKQQVQFVSDIGDSVKQHNDLIYSTMQKLDDCILKQNELSVQLKMVQESMKSSRRLPAEKTVTYRDTQAVVQKDKRNILTKKDNLNKQLKKIPSTASLMFSNLMDIYPVNTEDNDFEYFMMHLCVAVCLDIKEFERFLKQYTMIVSDVKTAYTGFFDALTSEDQERHRSVYKAIEVVSKTNFKINHHIIRTDMMNLQDKYPNDDFNGDMYDYWVDTDFDELEHDNESQASSVTFDTVTDKMKNILGRLKTPEEKMDERRKAAGLKTTNVITKSKGTMKGGLLTLDQLLKANKDEYS